MPIKPSKGIEYYKNIARLLGGEIPKLEVLWETLLDDPLYAHLSMDQKRAYYHRQPAMVRVERCREILPNEDVDKKEVDMLIWVELENLQIPLEEYVQNAKDNALSLFAVLKDGKWYEKGKMGWWGIITDKEDQKEWNKNFNELLDSLPDDILLTIVDCHI